MTMPHKNSVLGQARLTGDKATQQLIKERKRQAELDADSVEVWAKNDFQAGSIRTDDALEVAE